jgi:hypothetical protein
MNRLSPTDYATALARKNAREAQKARGPKFRAPLNCRQPLKRGKKRLRAKPDPKLVAWGRAVKKRDRNKCRFPGECVSGDNRIDPHHIATRGRRPDLIYNIRTGISLCRWHHGWVHDNPRQAERMGLLNFDSYELAQKIKAGYIVPGDENDKRVTL